ncbi:type II secretion system protein GspG [Stieleria varia]|uniref:Putative type II secretion system protein G n=1 Tax=Stieleria varia TaxID=2528005 RepID=A0A5C6B6J5_9BACT|nr:type II secretion system protein GspG [Stieleria varia]TWU07683.1 putative type II secretion system protein G precursor [Stieleria varia]
MKHSLPNSECHAPEDRCQQRRRHRGHSSTRSRSCRRGGFTLLELLLVLAILVVLGGIVVVNVVGTGEAAKADATQSQLKMVQSFITQYKLRMNTLPETLEELKDGPSDASLKAKWVKPIIERVPTDAWGKEIIYSVNGNTYELRSGGIDGQMNNDDDIVVTG